MEINIFDERRGDFNIESDYFLASTDHNIFVGGDMSIEDIFFSLSGLILKSYDVILEIIERNPDEFKSEEFNNFSFEQFMCELIDSIMHDLDNIKTIEIDKEETLKQLKEIDKKEMILDILNLIKKKSKDKNNEEDDDI